MLFHAALQVLPTSTSGHEVLRLVDVCQKSDLREQSATDPRRTAQLRKENPLRLRCSPRLSADSADKKVFSTTLRGQKMFLVALRVPSWIKKVFSASLRVLRGQKVFSTTLRGQKMFLVALRVPSWIKKMFSASLRVLRGQKGVLHDPSWTKDVLSGPSRPFVDKKDVLRVSPRPPRTKRCSPRPFVDKRCS